MFVIKSLNTGEQLKFYLKFSSCLTENSLHHDDQPVRDVSGHNRRLLLESYETQKHSVLVADSVKDVDTHIQNTMF